MHKDKYKKNGSVARLANLLGMNTRDNNYQAKGNIPKADKSKYTQEKWKFFLDADFEISGRCCSVMKKEPAHQYAKKTGRHPITAEMADESRLRTQQWLKNGCNGFQMKEPKATPMSFWTENDVLQYIYENKLPICPVYGDVVVDYDAMGELEGQVVFDDFKQDIKYKTTGCNRTGCCLCAFGAHLESKEDARFLMLKETHPKMYNLLDIIKNNGITYREAIEWTNEHLRDSQKIPL
jgi:3'-phosphoadenosine 5'-phosphosulfate sulfotransferase (PAPS reductase)/FAD synthetase